MKKKIIYTMAAAILICLLFTGCVSQKLNVTVSPKDGGSITGVLLIEESVYGMLNGMGENQIGADQNMIKGEETIDGKKYVTFTQINRYGTYAEMEKALLDMEYPGTGEGNAGKIFKTAEITKSGGLVARSYTVNLVTNAQETEANDDGFISFGGFDDIFKLILKSKCPARSATVKAAKSGTAYI